MVAYTTVMDTAYKALADPTRRLILEVLSEGSEQTLFELRTRLIMEHGVDISRQAIAKHLALLERAGMIAPVKSGRYKVLKLNTRPMTDIATWITSVTKVKEDV